MQGNLGKIILLTLPIGNMSDITDRVKQALKEGEVFFAEDTRNLKQIFNLLGHSLNHKEINSFHDHSEKEKIKKIVFEKISQGKNVFYVSDAGSPCLSDPGSELVELAWEHDWPIDSYSGISALTLALELSGFPSVPLTFHGFISRENNKREEFIEHKLAQKGTHLWFESPHRVSKFIDSIAAKWPKNEIFIGRELTKKFQSIERLELKDWEKVRRDLVFKGEFVLGFLQNDDSSLLKIDKQIYELADKIKQEGPSKKQVSKLIAKLLGENSKELYSKWQS